MNIPTHRSFQQASTFLDVPLKFYDTVMLQERVKYVINIFMEDEKKMGERVTQGVVRGTGGVQVLGGFPVKQFGILMMRAHYVLLCLRILMVFFCIWVLICGAVMASHYSYGSRETLIIAIILDALLMVFCIFLIIDVLKRYYLQFPVLTYATFIAIVVAGIVAWMTTASATVDILATLTIGNAWHTVTCLMIDFMTQRYAAGPSQLFYTQTSSTQTHTRSAVIQNNRHVDTNDG
ncbi:Prominin-like protein [Dirofilaria immitis]